MICRNLAKLPCITLMKSGFLQFRLQLLREVLELQFGGRHLRALYVAGSWSHKKTGYLELHFSRVCCSVIYNRTNLLVRPRIRFNRWLETCCPEGVTIVYSVPLIAEHELDEAGGHHWLVNVNQ